MKLRHVELAKKIFSNQVILVSRGIVSLVSLVSVIMFSLLHSSSGEMSLMFRLAVKDDFSRVDYVTETFSL